MRPVSQWLIAIVRETVITFILSRLILVATIRDQATKSFAKIKRNPIVRMHALDIIVRNNANEIIGTYTREKFADRRTA